MPTGWARRGPTRPDAVDRAQRSEAAAFRSIASLGLLLGRQRAHSFYDASYAAIAQRTGWTLVSEDNDLVRPGLAITIEAALAAA